MNLILDLYLENKKEELTGLIMTKINHTMFNLKMNTTMLKTRSLLFDFGIYINKLNSVVNLLLFNSDNKKLIVKKLNEIVVFEEKLLATDYYIYELN